MRWPKWLPRPGRGRPTRAAHLDLGDAGEREAVRHLKKKGYKILATNWEAKHDELDIVARKDDLLVIVEVKTRRGTRYGRPASAVTKEKRKRLSRAARQYLKRLKTKPSALRFDIIEVVWPEGEAPEITHLENAFTSEGGGSIRW